MTEPSKLVEKAIGRPNATWNSIKQQAVASVGASAVVRSRVYVVFAHERLHVIRHTLTLCHASSTIRIIIKGIFWTELIEMFLWLIGQSVVLKSQRSLVQIPVVHSFFFNSFFFKVAIMTV